MYVCARVSAEHEGSYGGGHYTAYVRREDGRWYHFNDARVTNVSEYEMTTVCAYILLYQREDITALLEQQQQQQTAAAAAASS